MSMQRDKKLPCLNEFKIESDSPKSYTHTRIPDFKLGIAGGKYYIPSQSLPAFYEKYYDFVYDKRNKEYLTEKQNEDGKGPILVDLDLRYSRDVKKRLHTDDDIISILTLYLEKIRKIYSVGDGCEFSVYIMHKPNVNCLEDKTKDGMHMVIGIQSNHKVQEILRTEVMNEIEEYLDDTSLLKTHLTNDWNSVFDLGITRGSVGWQLLGSRKPGHEAYRLTHIFHLQYSSELKNFVTNNIRIDTFDLKSNFHLLSAQYTENPLLELNPSIMQEYPSFFGNNAASRRKMSKKPSRIRIISDDLLPNEITNQCELDRSVESFLDNLVHSSEYIIKETHDYTMTLPVKFSEDYDSWIRVGFALKNTDSTLFITWLAFSAKSTKFDFGDIPERWEQWKKFDSTDDGLSRFSIIYWSRDYWMGIKPSIPELENPYLQVYRSSLDYFVDEAIQEPTDYNMAVVIHRMLHTDFICSGIKTGTWFEFCLNRWVEIDCGYKLSHKMSTDVYNVFNEKQRKLVSKFGEMDNDDSKCSKMQADIRTILSLSQGLKNNTNKRRILDEAKLLFYAKDFNEKADENPYLLGFKNGVVDFIHNVFRPGNSRDFITLSTNIKYVSMKDCDSKIIEEINDFMSKIFPNESIKQYMWEMLASCLIGINKPQTFNIFTGKGSNGKSLLLKFMSICLGDYHCILPLKAVTGQRSSVGQASPEIVAIKGRRIAQINEPSEGDTINEGIMKELTGGDKMQGRGLFKDPVSFVPQAKLVVATNTLMDIKSRDDGTWRRIRKVDFESKFVDKIDPDDKENPYQFLKDHDLERKMENWKETFMAMLVEIAYKTNGMVKDCDIVMQASNSYRLGQDRYAQFISERIVVDEHARCCRGEVKENYKSWYEEVYGNNEKQKYTALYEVLDKKYKPFAKGTNKGWLGIKIMTPHDD